MPRRRLLGLAAAAAVGGAAAGCGPPPVNPNVSALLTVTEVPPGEQRLGFALIDADGAAVQEARVRVRFVQLLAQDDVFRFEAPAREYVVDHAPSRQHHGGGIHLHVDSRSYYLVADGSYTPGLWRADLEVHPPDGEPYTVSSAFQVRGAPGALPVGAQAPASRNPTLREAASIEDLTTAEEPLAALYQHSVAEALARGEPLVAAFSTPAFCVARTCGPVTEVVAALARRYGDRVRFIHVEPYDLPLARSEGRLVFSGAALEWRLETEPWVFVVDADGRIAARFEGIVSAQELEPAIARVAGRPLA